MTPDHCPFPGLRPFHTDEDYLFFGRDAQVTRLLSRLRKSRFIAVVGSSGSGKSSLVRAGLIPSLTGGAMMQAGSSWEIALMRPGGRPIENLAQALAETELYSPDSPELVDRLTATFNRSRLGLTEAKRFSDTDKKTNLLLVVDQFEEVFRFVKSGQSEQDQAVDFVNLLLEATQQEEEPIYVALTMRSDFLGDCARFPGLAEAVNEGEYLVPRMTWDQCREAIEGPVGVGGGEIAPRLVDRLLNDIGEEPEQLPVLQHALMRMWEAWSSDRVTNSENGPLDLAHYNLVGGMSEALSRHADEVLEEYLGGDREQRLLVARRIFQALTERGSDNREIRRPASLEKLCAISGTPEPVVVELLDLYRRPGVTFLMPGEDRALRPETIIDISHESLMRVWQRLREWVEEESQSARVYRRLRETSELHGEGRAGLYSDPDLQIAQIWHQENNPNEAWARQYGGGFVETMAFLDKSEEAARQAERDAEAARRRELDHANRLAATQSRAASTFKRFAVGLGLLAMIAVALSVWSFVLADRSERSEKRADTKATEAEAARVVAEAAEQAERDARVAALESRDEAAHAEGRVWLEQARALVEEKKFLGAKLLAARAMGFEGFGREEEKEAFAKEYPLLLKRESEEWKQARSMVRDSPDYSNIWSSPVRIGEKGRLWNVEMSPDGSTIATGGEDGVVRIWNVASGKMTRRIAPNEGNIVALGFSPDGKILAYGVGNGSSIHVWSIPEQRDLGSLKGHFKPVRSISFSPDGKLLLSGSVDGTLRLWDVDTLRESAGPNLTNDASSQLGTFVTAADYSPDGRTLASGERTGRIQIWDVETFTVLHDLFEAHEGEISRLRYSRDGTLLASASFDGTVRIWEVEGGQQIVSFTGHSGRVENVSFHPDGRTVASCGADGTIRHWQIRAGVTFKAGEQIGEAMRAPLVPGAGSEAFDVSFAPSGKTLVSTHGDGHVRFWDVETGSERYEPAGHVAGLQAVSYSPDGRLLASAGDDGEVRLWEVASGKEIAVLDGHTGGVLDVAFSPDGTTLASASDDETVRIWDLETHTTLKLLEGHGAEVSSVAFSPDGKVLVSGSHDGWLRSWDPATGDSIERWAAESKVWDVAFAPDGTLASSGKDGAIWLWDLSTLASRRLRGHADESDTLDFSPDGSVLASGGSDHMVRLWDVRSGTEIGHFTGHTGLVGGICFSPDGTTLASSSMDGGDHTIRLWDVATQQHLATLEGHLDGVGALDFSPDGKTLASASADHSVRLWDVSRRQLAEFGETSAEITAVAYSPNDKFIASAGEEGGVLVRESDSYQPVVALQDVPTLPVNCLAFSPDGRLLAAAGRDMMVHVWELASGRKVWISDPAGNWMNSVSFSADGTRLVGASADHLVRLWEADTGRLIRAYHGHDHFVRFARFHPDGSSIISGAFDGTIRLWDPETNAEIASWDAHPAGVDDLDVNPEGDLLASCGFDGTVRLWELATRKEIAVLARLEGRAIHSPPARAIADLYHNVEFSPDGSLLAAVTARKLSIWDVATRQVVTEIEALENEFSWAKMLSFSADGTQLASGHADGKVRIWNSLRRPRDPSEVAGDLALFRIQARGIVPLDPRQLYRPAGIPMENVPPHSHLAELRRAEETGDKEQMWRDLFDRYLEAKNLPSALLVLSKLPPEISGEERAALGATYLKAAERELRTEDADLDKASGFLAEAERYAPQDPRLHVVRADVLEREGKLEEAEAALQRALVLAGNLGAKQGALLGEISKELLSSQISKRNWDRAREFLDSLVQTSGLADEDREELIEIFVSATVRAAHERHMAGEGDNLHGPLLLEVFATARREKQFVLSELSLLGALLQAARMEDPDNILVKRDADWHYLDDATDAGVAWRETEFVDTSWQSGSAPLGFGEFDDNRERHPLRRNLQGGFGDTTPTFYFRHAFDWDAGQQGSSQLHLEVARDDGVILYLNGEEIARHGMPSGAVRFETWASGVASGINEIRFFEFPGLDGIGILRPGSNVLAAEVHQVNKGSSDVNFELRLSRQVSLSQLVGDSAAVEEAIAEAVALLPKTVAEEWSEGMKFAFLESAESAGDSPDWRTRQRAQVLLGNGEAALEASRKGLEALEQRGVSSLPVRRELEMEIVDYLRRQGQVEAADVHLKDWLSRELQRSGALRINCGGDDFEDSQGREWMKDASHRGGSSNSYAGEIGGTEDDQLYGTMREFPWNSEDGNTESGYQIPLPEGRYRVTLHFVDIGSTGWIPSRPFDVLVGGRVVARNYSSTLEGPGFLMADMRSFAATTHEGVLEIAVRARLDLARLSAIEISPIDEAESNTIRIGNVEQTGWRDPEALAEWAEAAVESGDVREAVMRYERAARLPKVTRVQLDRLRELRAKLSPDLASFASVDAVLGQDDGPERDEKLEAFRKLESSPRQAQLLTYLKGRTHQLAGRDAEALAVIEEVAGKDSGQPELLLRVAECLHELGRHQEAEQKILEAWRSGQNESAELLILWIRLSTQLGRSREQSLQLLADLKTEVIPEWIDLAATSEHQSQAWRYTTTTPAEGWEQADFNDSSWSEGDGGFGTSPPAASGSRTLESSWKTPGIWLRRTFSTQRSAFLNPHLRIIADDGATVFLNGVEVARVAQYTLGYVDIPLTDPALLVEGINTIAVQAHEDYAQTQHVDVGIVEPLADEILARQMFREHGAIRINCGGREYRSARGSVWGRDRFFTGGQLNVSALVPGGGFSGPVDGTEDDPLYQTERWQSRGTYAPLYRFPVPDGPYVVNLHFVHSERGVSNSGGRVFHIELEGDAVMADYDIFDSVGKFTADTHTFQVKVADGALDLGFEHLRSNPTISAIEIVPARGK